MGGTIRTAIRNFNAINCGKIFFSAMMRYDFGEASGGGQAKFVGLSLMNGATEELFVGEISTLDASLGVDPLGDGTGGNPRSKKEHTGSHAPSQGSISSAGASSALLELVPVL